MDPLNQMQIQVEVILFFKSKLKKDLITQNKSQNVIQDFNILFFLELRSKSKSQPFNKALVVSTMYLVDLAGSERVKKSLASGERLNETKHINSSLSTLGKCIHELSSEKPKYIPFRDSKLTRLL